MSNVPAGPTSYVPPVSVDVTTLPVVTLFVKLVKVADETMTVAPLIAATVPILVKLAGPTSIVLPLVSELIKP